MAYIKADPAPPKEQTDATNEEQVNETWQRAEEAAKREIEHNRFILRLTH